MEHTPGPWHVGIVEPGIVFADHGRLALGADGTTLYPICRMVAWDERCDEDRANARLIAAAPALLAALEESRREAVYLRDTWVGAGPSCARGVVVRLINRIDAAIKAARGQA